jgi:hypothetical protein
MLELPPLSVAAILSGGLSGAILGASLATETERRLRGGGANLQLFVNNSTTALLLNVFIPLLLAGGIVLIVSVGIAKLVHAYPLSLSYKREWAISLLAGAGPAKCALLVLDEPQGVSFAQGQNPQVVDSTGSEPSGDDFWSSRAPRRAS